MSVISFYSSKGGAGKTTSLMALASVLHHKLNFNICIVDADPNLPLARWDLLREETSPFKIIPCLEDSKIPSLIKELSYQYDFVLVDVEGSKNIKASHAISKSDLVVVPSQRSRLDAEQAAEAVKFIHTQMEVLEKKIHYCLSITNTSGAIRSKALTSMRDSLSQKKLNLCSVELYNRETFKAVFDYSKTLYELSEHKDGRVGKAIVNAEGYAHEILKILKSTKDLQIPKQLLIEKAA